ncbi:MAG: ABC transporter permease [Terriglobales bacterium]
MRRWSWAIVGVATLALGVGAATALFSVVHAVLLEPLPIPQPAQVLTVSEASRQVPALALSYPDFLDLRSSNHTFSSLAATRPSLMALTHLGAPAMVAGERVSADYFSLLGVRPQLGRAFHAADDAEGAAPVVVVSDRFWRERLTSDPAWLGRAIELDGRARTIVGIMPPGLPLAGGSAQFWTPIGPYIASHPGLDRRGSRVAITALARLRPGVTLAQARVDLGALSARLARAYPASNAGISAAAQPLLDSVAGNAQPVLWGLLVATGLLLLLACANVANLLLAHGARQVREDAVRSALGATPMRLLGRRLRESLGLAAMGVAAGCGLALMALHSAPALLASLPRTPHPGLDAPVLGFAVILAIGTALLCGLAPALASARTQPASVLAHAGAGGVAAGHRRLRAALVGGQLMLALLLMTGTGLLLRSVGRLQAVDPGFVPEGRLTFVVGLPSASYPGRSAQLAFFSQAEQRLAHLPGVTAAGGVMPLPFAIGGIPQPVSIPGAAPPPGQAPTADIANVRGDYFGAMGVPVLSGRAFTPADNGTSAPVAIVDDVFVRRFWPGIGLATALGRTVELAGARRTLVGIVGHVRESGLIGPLAPEAYVPQAQARLFVGALFFVLRTPLADPMRLRAAAAAQIAAVDPNQPIAQLQTMASLVQATLAQPRLVLSLLEMFALLALALAALGVYSALSYAVAQRTREIGVRMALGAERGRVVGEVLAKGMQPAWWGTAAGLALALGLGQLASAFLPDVSPQDPLTLTAAAVILLGVAAAACFIPARRAARVEPLAALREP